MTKLEFEAADIERLFNHRVAKLALWRTRGVLSGYGTQGENGRWVYTYLDMLGFFIADALNSYLGLEAALQHGRMDANGLLHWAQSLASDTTCAAPRFRAYLHTVEGPIHSSGVKSLGELDSEVFVTGLILDFKGMALELPKFLKALAPLAETE